MNLFTLRLLSVVLIFVVGLLPGFLTVIFSKRLADDRVRRIIRLGNAVAGGVFLGACREESSAALIVSSA